MSSTDSTNGGSNVLEDQLKQASLSSKQEQARLNKEADVVSEKTKRLREQVDDLEREEKRLRDNASAAGRLHESLDFEALCLALRRNDVATTVVSESFKFPNGYAKSLGQALDRNTQVSSLEICLVNAVVTCKDDELIMSEDTKEQALSLGQFIVDSQALRSVRIFDRHPIDDVNLNLACLFLETSLDNPHVEHITVHLDRVPKRPFERLYYDAVPSKLQTIVIDFSELGDPYAPPYSHEERRVIGGAFEYFTCLSSLEMSAADSHLAESILAGLHRGGAHELRELKLNCPATDGNPPFWTALSALLRAAKQFCRLALGFFSFHATNMPSLQSCLRHDGNNPDGASLTTITELSFFNCHFDQAAIRLLKEFMHTRVQPRTSNGCSAINAAAASLTSAVGPSSLTKLNIDCGMESNDLSAHVLVSMLRLQQSVATVASSESNGKEYDYYPTIGSQIESLSLFPVAEFHNFLRLLNKNADRICLSTLILVGMYARRDCRDLPKCISNIPSLQTLDISEMDISARPILASLRANGSIQSATISGSKSSEATSKLAAAYTERNRLLDGLLLSSSSGRSKDQETSSDSPMPACPTEENYCNSSCSTETQGGMSFSPTLWAAAQDVPSTASSKMIRSLLQLCERIQEKPAVDESQSTQVS